jgi:hypothetical protein
VLVNQGKSEVNLAITDYNDVSQEVKKHIIPTGANFKKKNNIEVFNEMTKDEWIQSAVQENGSTDLEIIINKILS